MCCYMVAKVLACRYNAMIFSTVEKGFWWLLVVWVLLVDVFCVIDSFLCGFLVVARVLGC